MPSEDTVLFAGQALSIEDVDRLARRQATSQLSDASAFISRIEHGADWIEQSLKSSTQIYGVTTGFGDSCDVNIPTDGITTLPRQLYTFHGCGLGEPFGAESTRAIIAARLNSLALGYSGVRYCVLQRLTLLLQHDILPRIPQEGSVGASGDLTPLSYVAAVLAGERDVYYQGQRQSASNAWSQLDLSPLQFRPKEVLAIMNGTAVMTGLACLAWSRAEYLVRLATRITSFAVIALQGRPDHFAEVLFNLKPHPGQGRVAARLRADLADIPQRDENRLQDRYSLRCAPHVLGVLEDALPWLRQLIETELNSVTDNPIIDIDHHQLWHGGHFYGGHIALAMDTLKTAVANVADLLDRQLAQLVDPKFNQGLPANLAGASSDINHGLKAVQIGVSAWTAEALKLTMPASVFSRSTECHNQDKVSMGTIAARDALRVIELTEQVAVAVLLAALQAVELRGVSHLPESLALTVQQVRTQSPALTHDRALEDELRRCLDCVRQRLWSFYDDKADY